MYPIGYDNHARDPADGRRELVVLLCGGDKGSQRKDIARAKQLAERLE